MRARKWNARLRGWKWVVVLSIVMALVAWGLTLFLESFYSYTLPGYDPHDENRGKMIEKQRTQSE